MKKATAFKVIILLLTLFPIILILASIIKSRYYKIRYPNPTYLYKLQQSKDEYKVRCKCYGIVRKEIPKCGPTDICIPKYICDGWLDINSCEVNYYGKYGTWSRQDYIDEYGTAYTQKINKIKWLIIGCYKNFIEDTKKILNNIWQEIIW
ncbi:hypothetical protein ACFLZ1_03400 [Patescibacteria group bacterium]